MEKLVTFACVDVALLFAKVVCYVCAGPFYLVFKRAAGTAPSFLESFACKMVKEREEVLEKKRKKRKRIDRIV